MLLEVLGPKSGYTRGKGSGYGGSIKARINEEQQQKIREQQKQIEELQIRLDASQKEMEEHKATQQRNMIAMEERLMQAISNQSTRSCILSYPLFLSLIFRRVGVDLWACGPLCA